jgi:hypothetical protein
VRVVIEFRYSRSVGWLKRLLPRRHRSAREEVKRHFWVTFDGDSLRREIGGYWRIEERDVHRRMVAILDGHDPDANGEGLGEEA